MSAKVRSKLKGIIFSERPGRPPQSGLPASRDDSRAGLITHARRHGAQSLGDTDHEESDDGREGAPGVTQLKSDVTPPSAESSSRTAPGVTQLKSNVTPRSAESSSRKASGVSKPDVTQQLKPECGGNGFTPTHSKPRPTWQRSLKDRVTDGPRRPHDSTSHVHVTNDAGEGQEELTRHYMQSQNNIPVRIPDKKSSIPIDSGGDQRLLLNVGGVRHETHVATLRNVPSSRLSRLAEWHVSSGGGRLEYFFDRHPAVFNSIIDFYRTGK
ncbi:hypothetical protein EGW08_016395 [Elysia chlorotica]|uniref:Potassium channel tetramerisation-type BTB domain-containing protein n=1 Tax=Elysia chlorotica TaxID=188477 RepID=A0A433T2R2_ELYCH|nr:hypothetical protein EGW08_016395 [Elysia chlorotica]